MIMMTGADYSNQTQGSSSSTDPMAPSRSSPDLPSESGYIGPSNTGPPLCAGCNQPILDQFILQVQGRMWHSDCLRCCLCSTPLLHMCYAGHSELYCQEDFFRLFGAKCTSCNGTISPTEMVRRAHENIYHIDCFRCSVCCSELYTGDQFYLCDEGQLLCQLDFVAVRAKKQNTDGNTNSATACDEERQKLFRHYYVQNSKPKRDVIEKIALEAGIELSEVRTWFRQQRAKDRRKSNGHNRADEIQSDMAARVLAPPGGYPLPIVNKAVSPGRLPEGANHQHFMLTQEQAHTTGSHAYIPGNQTNTHENHAHTPGSNTHWTAWEELWSNDFVPPNVNLVPENINNGEVVGYGYQL